MLVEVYALEDASCILKKTLATLAPAASRAFARSPDAMATTLMSWLYCMAGMTFLRPIAAVRRTPRRSLLGMVAMIRAGQPPFPRSGVSRPTIIVINYPALHLMPAHFARKRWVTARANGSGLD